VEEVLCQFDHIAAGNACAKQNSQNLGISQRINTALEKFFAGLFLIR
jgi:hypothetical protein